MGSFCIKNVKAFSEISAVSCLHLTGQNCGKRQPLTEKMSGKANAFAGHIITRSKIKILFLKEERGRDIEAAISKLCILCTAILHTIIVGS